MLEKLQAIVRRLDQVERQLSDPAIYADREMLTRLSREQKELTPIVSAFRAWQQAEDDCAQAQELLTDPEMRELAQEELRRARQERDRLSQELKTLLLPRDPNDDRNVILEVRAGIGGEEGALFAADLLGVAAFSDQAFKAMAIPMVMAAIGIICSIIIGASCLVVFYLFLAAENGDPP